MSGGSYNYLCYQLDSHGHLDLGDLESMRDRLRELAPDSLATEATARLYDTLNLAAGASPRGLAEVWRAVEWHDSGDCGADRVRKVLEQYASGDLADTP